MLLSLLQTWFVLDPIFILARNNLRLSRHQRTGKYQVAEKGMIGLLLPILGQ